MTTAVADPFTIPADMPEPYEPPTEPIPVPESDGRLTAEQMAERTPEFPYGRRADGTPRSRPGPKAAGTTPRPVSAPKPRKTSRPAAKPAVPDYRPGILGILQIPAMGLSMVGRQTKNDALQADGYAIAMHAPVLAEALNETAKQQPGVARALESILKAGPYGAIIAAVVPLAMQLAANHGIMQPSPKMGIHHPADLVAASNDQMAAMAGAAAGS